MTLHIDGLSVELTRKKVKNLRLSIHPPDGQICITAPHSFATENIIRFVREKRGWIDKQLASVNEKRALTPEQWVSGDSISIFGNRYTLEVAEDSAKAWVEPSASRIVLHMHTGSTTKQRQDMILNWCRELLRTEVEHYFPIWEEQTGLKCSSWQIRNMTTRWGSCNPKSGKIWLSLNLFNHPVVCLEYVILHELAHLKYPNHGAEFKEFIGSFMLDWKERRRLLNS